MSCMFKNRLDSEEYDEYMERGNENRGEIVSNLAVHFNNILTDIGEDPLRQGLLRTPERAAKAFCYYTCGYNIKLEGKLQGNTNVIIQLFLMIMMIMTFV